MIRIKRILFLLVLLFNGTLANSQNFVCDWVRSVGGERWDLASDIVIDNEKNIYLTGGFEKVAFFGNDSLISAGERDIFIAKYDSLGSLIWVKKAGGKKYDNAIDIETDNDNNILLTGNFQDTVYFEGKKLITDNYMNNFLAKYSTDGNLRQVKRINAETKSEKLFITPANNNDFFLSGTYYNQMSIDNDTILSGGKSNIFIACFGSDLECKSLVNIGGFSELSLKDIKYLDEDLYLLCEFKDSPDVNGKRFLSYGNSDILMMKVDTTGTVKNIKHFAGLGKDEAGSLITDKDSNIYVSLEFESVLYFDEDSLFSKGGKDILLMKTDNSFNTLWYKQIGSNTDEYSNTLLINSADAVYLTGSFSDSLTIENKTVVSKNFTTDMFIAKYTPDGNNTGLKQAGGNGNEYRNVLVNDPDNYLYIIGNYDYDFAFENETGSDSVLSNYGDDIFIARFYDCDYAYSPDIGADTSFCGYGSLQVRNPFYFQADTTGSGINIFYWNNGLTGNPTDIFNTGYYYVKSTDWHKCKVNSDSVFIEINPLPEPDLGEDIYIETNEKIELFGGLFESYLWSNETINETCLINPDTLGNITNIFLEVTDINSCKGRDSINIYKLYNSGIKNITITPSVYPNPNNGLFYINLKNADETVENIKVFDINGSLIYEQNTFQNKKYPIRLDKKGQFLIVIETQNRHFFEKLIVN